MLAELTGVEAAGMMLSVTGLLAVSARVTTPVPARPPA